MPDMTTLHMPTALSPNRREATLWMFIAVSLLALIGLLTMLGIFSYPRPQVVTIGKLSDFPAGAEPKWFYAGGTQLYVVNVNGELIVFDAHDTHSRGCIIKWIPSNNLFEDPCAGSKYEIDGTALLDSPAPRGLDRYTTIIDAGGNIMVILGPTIRGTPRD